MALAIKASKASADSCSKTGILSEHLFLLLCVCARMCSFPASDAQDMRSANASSQHGLEMAQFPAWSCWPSCHCKGLDSDLAMNKQTMNIITSVHTAQWLTCYSGCYL